MHILLKSDNFFPTFVLPLTSFYISFMNYLCTINSRMIAFAIFIIGASLCQAQDATMYPPVNKTAAFKESFTKSVRYCAAIHETNLVQAMALFAQRENEDSEAKCFLHCMLQRYNLMDKSGRFNRDKFKPFFDYIPASNFLKSIRSNLQTCLKEAERSTDPCIKAYTFCRCFYQRGGKKPGSNGQVTPAEGFQ